MFSLKYDLNKSKELRFSKKRIDGIGTRIINDFPLSRAGKHRNTY